MPRPRGSQQTMRRVASGNVAADRAANSACGANSTRPTQGTR
ncbi:hypothetical protein C7S17_7470 [Burkholderia thailandensis]|nr:hypothetical protein [Burkholderia thailandensis]